MFNKIKNILMNYLSETTHMRITPAFSRKYLTIKWARISYVIVNLASKQKLIQVCLQKRE